MNGINTPNHEVHQFRTAAQIASIYHRDENFERKSNISEIVHGTFHLCQLTVAVTLIVFHHVHHAANRIAQEQNKDVPTLPEEKNPVFIVFPACMMLSLILAILRFGTRKLVRRPAIPMTFSFVGAMFMFIGAISAMRHAEIHINIAESWILYDFWLSEKRERQLVNTVDVIQSGSSNVSFNDAPTVSRESSNERRRCIKTKDKKNKNQKYDMQEQPGILDPVVTLDKLPSYRQGSQMDVQSFKFVRKNAIFCTGDVTATIYLHSVNNISSVGNRKFRSRTYEHILLLRRPVHVHEYEVFHEETNARVPSRSRDVNPISGITYYVHTI
ncbi:uncharacterized protein LOC107273977 [Cephus cinctus]|uniref:Uncharacterized protein LOC107273977 n=1 Tax=Cephus cinctus TaxID=211228 RepID=A0AAJ7W745_CEPCN|nr:uncharacterized protein LOC107273977 [Cephus cinctus]